MRWRIIDGPNGVEDSGATDGVLCGFTIERVRAGSARRGVVVVISRSALASDREGLPGDVREAIETGGRTALERYMDDEDPPGRLLVSSTSIGPSADGV